MWGAGAAASRASRRRCDAGDRRRIQLPRADRPGHPTDRAPPGGGPGARVRSGGGCAEGSPAGVGPGSAPAHRRVPRAPSRGGRGGGGRRSRLDTREARPVTVSDAERIERNMRALRDADLDAVLCALPSNVLLLSGYWPVVGTSIAVATRDGAVGLVTPADEADLAGRGWADATERFYAGVARSSHPIDRSGAAGAGADPAALGAGRRPARSRARPCAGTQLVRGDQSLRHRPA